MIEGPRGRANRLRICRVFLRSVLFGLFVLPNTNLDLVGFAEEPAAKFLQSLKDSGYYDEALKYLEISAQRNRLPESLKADLGLEKIMLLQMSLMEVRTAKDLDEKLGQVEQGFKEFLTN